MDYNEKLKELENARSSQNALKYYRLFNELGRPEEEKDEFLYEKGEADIIYSKNRQKEEKKTSLRERDSKLVRAVEDCGINFSSIDSNLEGKKKIIKGVLGRYYLTIGRGSALPLEQCKPERINSMLEKEYESAVRRLSKH